MFFLRESWKLKHIGVYIFKFILFIHTPVGQKYIKHENRNQNSIFVKCIYQIYLLARAVAMSFHGNTLEYNPYN